ncbi:hypothetical protein BHE90_017585 [Fusarium euwallaceae]|uniref:Uncharacterized protein n=1 Tax=Fusarium euwallaceae TaxID=1147111 RepID=A0A430KX31_9HYPO|nr:hypothetical protein BHE90_017585 [Fusarium euwallaceae]
MSQWPGLSTGFGAPSTSAWGMPSGVPQVVKQQESAQFSQEKESGANVEVVSGESQQQVPDDAEHRSDSTVCAVPDGDAGAELPTEGEEMDNAEAEEPSCVRTSSPVVGADVSSPLPMTVEQLREQMESFFKPFLQEQVDSLRQCVVDHLGVSDERMTSQVAGLRTDVISSRDASASGVRLLAKSLEKTCVAVHELSSRVDEMQAETALLREAKVQMEAELEKARERSAWLEEHKVALEERVSQYEAERVQSLSSEGTETASADGKEADVTAARDKRRRDRERKHRDSSGRA